MLNMKSRRITSVLLASLLLASCIGCTLQTADDPGTETNATNAVTTETVTIADTVTEMVTIPGTDAVTEPQTNSVTEPVTDPVTLPETEPETEPPVPEITLTVDDTYVLYLSDRADSTTRAAVYMMADAFREKAGLELAIVDPEDGTEAKGIYLEVGEVDEARGHRMTVQEGAVTITATDPEALYFGAEAVLEAWLAPELNCVGEGTVYVDDLLAADFTAAITRLDNSIRILTQNVRGTDDPDGNTVQNRTARFIQLVEEYQPDLIGTQEYTYAWQVWLQKHEKKAGGTEENRIYGQIGCSRNGPNSPSGEKNVILYRLDRFELLDSNTFWLTTTPDVPSSTVMNTDKRICTWAKLKDKQTGEVFVFANTHLDHTDDEVRSIQATILLEQLAGIVGDLPLYLTGDFNCVTHSAPYSLVAENLKDSHITAWKAVNSTYGTYHAYNTYGWEIDFIFHPESATAIHYEIVTKSYDGFVSDHYGVFVEFVN